MFCLLLLPAAFCLIFVTQKLQKQGKSKGGIKIKVSLSRIKKIIK
jgi:hypothetical protein